MRTVVIALVLAAGCGKGKDAGKETKPPSADEAATAFVVDGAKEDIPAIKAAIASDKPEDAEFKCAQMANIDTLKQAAPDLAKELTQLCTHDMQLAIMKVEVQKAEAARKAKPDEKVLSECYSAGMTMALKELHQHGTEDAASRALAARFAAACPD